MPHLQCSVGRCENNSEGLCCRPDIHVGGQNAQSSSGTSCRSYAQRTDGFNNSSVTQCVSPNMSLDISCSARNCVFNANRLCSADMVSIGLGGSRETECSSFKQDR